MGTDSSEEYTVLSSSGLSLKIILIRTEFLTLSRVRGNIILGKSCVSVCRSEIDVRLISV